MINVVKTEPNLHFLRTLMSEFYQASPKALTLLSQVEILSSSPEVRFASSLHELWKKEAEFGPVPQPVLTRIEEQARTRAEEKGYGGYYARAWNKVAMAGPVQDERAQAEARRAYDHDVVNARGIFFAHLIEFVRHIKNPHPQTKFHQFSPLSAENGDYLKSAVDRNLSKIVTDLNRMEIRNLILTECTPAQLERTVRPIPAPRPSSRSGDTDAQISAPPPPPFSPAGLSDAGPFLH